MLSAGTVPIRKSSCCASTASSESNSFSCSVTNSKCGSARVAAVDDDVRSQISSSVELSAGTVVPQDEGDAVDWTKLGSLSFDANERSGFLARELKSVHVTAEGDALRLRLFDCHANKLNTDRQVRRCTGRRVDGGPRSSCRSASSR